MDPHWDRIPGSAHLLVSRCRNMDHRPVLGFSCSLDDSPALRLHPLANAIGAPTAPTAILKVNDGQAQVVGVGADL